MGLWKAISRAKELSCAVALDVVSMGGIWAVNGQSATGEKIDEFRDEDDASVTMEDVIDVLKAAKKIKEQPRDE